MLPSLLRQVSDALAAARDREQQQAPYTAPRFDPFDFLDARENGLSRMLAWMLDPRGSHGQGAVFMEQFLRLLPLERKLDAAALKVATERVLTGGGAQYGRIDIAISGDGAMLLLENKPTAGEHGDQLARYVRHVDDERGRGRIAMLVLLLGRDQDALKDHFFLMLHPDVSGWVADCAKRSRNEDVAAFLRRFARHLEWRHGMPMNDEEKEAVIAQISAPDHLEAALAVRSHFEEAERRIVDDFAKAVRARWGAAPAGLADKPPLTRTNGWLTIASGVPGLALALEIYKGYPQTMTFGLIDDRSDPDRANMLWKGGGARFMRRYPMKKQDADGYFCFQDVAALDERFASKDTRGTGVLRAMVDGTLIASIAEVRDAAAEALVPDRP